MKIIIQLNNYNQVQNVEPKQPMIN